MRRFLAALLMGSSVIPLSQAADFAKVSFPPPPAMTCTDVWYAKTATTPRAVLVLCPGMNGNGKPLLENPKWQKFAADHRLGLMAISFSSPPEKLYAGYGYTFPEQGSGDILLKAIRSVYGREIPILLYGFSSGAYFTELFVAWHPSSVMAWCAHATGAYEEKPGPQPPGIVSCGDRDPSRLGSALMHFKRGRARGNALLWIEVSHSSHEWPDTLHAFVQDYFASILEPSNDGRWIDVETGALLSEAAAAKQPTLSGWMPSKSLESSWKKLLFP